MNKAFFQEFNYTDIRVKLGKDTKVEKEEIVYRITERSIRTVCFNEHRRDAELGYTEKSAVVQHLQSHRRLRQHENSSEK